MTIVVMLREGDARQAALPVVAGIVLALSAWSAIGAAPSAWDAAGRDLVRRHVTEGLFDALARITDLAWTPALVPASAIVAAVSFARGRRREAARFLVTMIAAVAITALLKVILDRPRPPPMARTMGFPSGHVVVGACFYLGLARLVPEAMPRARMSALAAAAVLVLMVTASRLVLGNHYPSDVTAGLALSALLLWSDRRAR